MNQRYLRSQKIEKSKQEALKREQEKKDAKLKTLNLPKLGRGRPRKVQVRDH